MRAKLAAQNLSLFPGSIEEPVAWPSADLLLGDALEKIRSIPSESVTLVLTSPPYNIGKEYEKEQSLTAYLDEMKPILKELVRALSNEGNIAWQVGNYVNDGEVFPLDILYYQLFKDLGLKLRNRIVWHFDHGLHATHRLSGRYETILWFSKSDDYVWNLDPIRVPSKYPGKRVYKPGPRYGLPSGNPLGKNPSDYWKIVEQDWDRQVWSIPNVKSNHPEKTIHPCSFPIELAERCVLALSNPDDLVIDPFCGVGSVLLAAMMRGRRSTGIDRDARYLEVAAQRIVDIKDGTLPYRQLGKPIHQPSGREKISQRPDEWRTE